MSNDTRQTASDRACSSAVGLTLEDLQAAIRACSPAAYLIVSEYVTAGQTFRLQAAPADLPFVGRGQRDAGIRWVVSADDLAELAAGGGWRKLTLVEWLNSSVLPLLAPPAPRSERAQELTADDVEWVVNDSAELGVKIGNQFFFCYKGRSLIYEEGTHDDGKPMMWRPVFKREFGECVHPVNYTDPRKIGTVSLDDSDDWKPLPSSLPPSPLSAVPAECCGAIHEGLTGAVCELAKGHIGNHRGSFGRGHSAQWPVTPLSAQPTAQEPETNMLGDHECWSCHLACDCCQPSECMVCSACAGPKAAPSVPPATTALPEVVRTGCDVCLDARRKAEAATTALREALKKVRRYAEELRDYSLLIGAHDGRVVSAGAIAILAALAATEDTQ